MQYTRMDTWSATGLLDELVQPPVFPPTRLSRQAAAGNPGPPVGATPSRPARRCRPSGTVYPTRKNIRCSLRLTLQTWQEGFPGGRPTLFRGASRSCPCPSPGNSIDPGCRPAGRHGPWDYFCAQTAKLQWLRENTDRRYARRPSGDFPARMLWAISPIWHKKDKSNAHDVM
jgi:hypothetical protein